MLYWNFDWARASMESEVGFGFSSACTVAWVGPVDCCESENSLDFFVFLVVFWMSFSALELI